ncbi:MAG: hypothetical protein OEZ02_07585 [Anaerolineae bacterium]|nr:hypothetical protein [Anaerolineae bacterium]
MAKSHRFTAKIEQDEFSHVVLVSPAYLRLVRLAFVGLMLLLLALLGVFYMTNEALETANFLGAAVLLFLPMAGIAISPLRQKLEIDFSAKKITLQQQYLFSAGSFFHSREQSYAIADIFLLPIRPGEVAGLALVTRQNETIAVRLPRSSEEYGPLRKRLEGILSPAPVSAAVDSRASNLIVVEDQDDQELPLPARDVMVGAMQAEIRSWGRTLLFLGALHFITPGFLDAGWGITLVAVGLGSFIFRESAMFVIYAFVLLWVGLMNSISGGIGGWTFFGVYQIYLGVRIFPRFRKFRQAEKEHLAALEQAGEQPGKAARRAERVFPGLGLLMGTLSLLAVACMLTLVVLVLAAADGMETEAASGAAEESSKTLEIVITLIFGLTQSMGIGGFGMSLASLFAGYEPKWLGWAGVIIGGLAVTTFFVLMLLFNG